MDWLFFNTAQKDSLNYWYLNVWELGDSSSNHANKLISIQKEEENPSSSTSKQPTMLQKVSQFEVKAAQCGKSDVGKK